MNEIIWLSSYPKSGSTWLRALLESILYLEGGPVNLNHLNLTVSSRIDRVEFDSFIGLQSTDLTLEETWKYKRAYFTHLWKNRDERLFVKMHEANLKIDSNHSLIPPELTKLAIYMVRNPLDIVASLANHMGMSIEDSIEQLSCSSFLPFNNTGFKSTSKVYSKSDTWSNHIDSWINQTDFPVHIIKYEDLSTNPIKTLKGLLEVLGVTKDEDIIRRAIENASFKKLSSIEKKEGFTERSPYSSHFFRKGEIDGWKNELTQEQAARVRKNHSIVMQKMGY